MKNAWYVAARSEDVGRALLARKLLGARVVLYRKGDGSPVALEDACPHRKLQLSRGQLRGDTVECGYHGLTFDGAGRCVAAPTQPGSVPGRAQVASYPVLERYGFIWVWMGDPSRADPGAMIEIPHFDDSNWGRTPRGAMEIACNYLWVTDNLLDPSHVAWVHVTSFAGASTDDAPLSITEGEQGLVVWRWIANRPPPPYYEPILSFSGPVDRKQHYEMRLPSIAINKSVYTRAGSGGNDAALPPDAFVNISYNFITPVDEDHSLYFWFQHRNARADDESLSQQMFAGAKMAFEEDREVLELVHEGMKAPETPSLNLGLDAGAMRFRRMLDRAIAAESA